MNQYLKSSVKVMAAMMVISAPAFAGGNVSKDVKVASAAKAPCAEALKGFTVGADIAYNYSKAKHEELSLNFNSPAGNGKGISLDSIEHKRCNIDPSINIGYTHIYNNWYMGAAGEISFGKKGKRDTAFRTNTSARTQISGFAGGVKLKGGYFVKDLKTAIYGLVGIKWRDVDFRFNVSGIEGSKAKLKRPLYVLGLGVERPIYKKLSVSAEYEYAWRNSNDTSVVNLPNNATASSDLKQRLNDHSFKIGVKYHI